MARVYYGEFTSIAGVDYRVEIWDEPSGSATGGTELILSGPGFTMETQGEGDPIYENFIRKSKATGYFIVNNSTDENYFTQIAVTDEAKYALVIYRNTSLFWVGRILPDQMQWQRSPVDANIEFQISAVDTLSLLKNYTVDPTWFSSVNRLNILDLIRLSLAKTGLHNYWNHLGFSNDYIREAIQSYMGDVKPTEFIKKWEINLQAVIKDFQLFVSPNLDTDESDVYLSCEEIIEECLGIFGGRLFLDTGKYWIIQPIAYSVYTTSIDYRVYSTAGIKTNSTLQNFAHKVNLSTVGRPRFESFPTLTNQPAVRYFEQRYKRLQFKTAIRKKSNLSSTVFEITNFNSFQFNPIKIKATLNFGVLTWAGNTIPAASKVYIAFRAYSYTTGIIRIYNSNTKDWEVSPTLPDYESVECKIFKVEQAGSFNSIITVDFLRDLDPAYGVQDLFFQFQIIGLQNSAIGSGVSTGINMWGSIIAWQEEGIEKKVRVSNVSNVNAAKVVSKEVIFYSYGQQMFDNYRGGLYILGDTPNNYWTSVNGSYNPLNSALCADYMSIHAKAVRVIQGSWVDAGTYSKIKTLFFDSSIWVFNAGKFNALYEKWDAEWLRIAHNVEDVIVGDEEDYEDYKNAGGNALVRLIQQTEETRESINNIFDAIPFRALRDSVGAPTTAPTSATDYVLKLRFDPSTNNVQFKTEQYNPNSNVLIDGGTFETKNSFIDAGGFVTE